MQTQVMRVIQDNVNLFSLTTLDMLWISPKITIILYQATYVHHKIRTNSFTFLG